MCINQKYIFTRSRFISLHHDERLLVPVKCGKCYECQQQKRDEWYYRIYYEWLSTLDSSDCRNPYVFFDTLTYSDEYLPHISEFFDISFPKKYDFPCFCYEDLRLFFVRLRRNLSYAGYDIGDKLRYFVSSEYGTAEQYTDSRGVVRVATHRPHYHVLFFITADLPVAILRHAVNDAWFFGRTDRVRYYGRHSNYFCKGNHDSVNTRSVSSYVAKYVQKLSSFQDKIDFRITEICKYLFLANYCFADVTSSVASIDTIGYRYLPSNLATSIRFRYDSDGFASFCRSANGSKLLRDVTSLVSQFHRQSKGFGEYALHDMDILSIMSTGHVTLPDSLHVIKSISVPLYYERKIFYEQIIVDGHKMWQLNSLGIRYKRIKEDRSVSYLERKFHTVCSLFDYHPDVSFRELAHYCVYVRFRNNGSVRNIPTILDKLDYPDIMYNYSCPSDRSIFHEALVSRQYVGMSGCYYSHCLDYSIPISIFLRDHMKIIPEYESILHKIHVYMFQLSIDVQKKYDYIIAAHNRKQMQLSLV